LNIKYLPFENIHCDINIIILGPAACFKDLQDAGAHQEAREYDAALRDNLARVHRQIV
jgi:hypothetical protein